jgi:hypothetical protein
MLFVLYSSEHRYEQKGPTDDLRIVYISNMRIVHSYLSLPEGIKKNKFPFSQWQSLEPRVEMGNCLKSIFSCPCHVMAAWSASSMYLSIYYMILYVRHYNMESYSIYRHSCQTKSDRESNRANKWWRSEQSSTHRVLLKKNVAATSCVL